MRTFCYPVTLSPDEKDGGYVVTFKDVPEAITQGDTVEEALEEASDCLEEAIAGRIRRGDEIPAPSQLLEGQYEVFLPIATAMKAALYSAIHEAGLSKVELSVRLGCDEKEVRRLLDPHHPSKLPRIEKALEALGKQLVILVRDSKDLHEAELVSAS